MTARSVDATGAEGHGSLASIKAPVTPEVFASIDLRVGRVTHAEPFLEAHKPALKVTVDFGPKIGVLRTSAQITNYATEELIGLNVVGVVNLGSKKIAGFTSEFLILGAVDSDGVVSLLSPSQDVSLGAPIT